MPILKDQPLPALRPVDMFPSEHDGTPVIVMRDPIGISEAVLSLPLAAYYIIRHFDGETTAAAIQASVQGRYGMRVRVEDIEALSDQLDEQYLLESPRYRARRLELEKEYAALPARPAVHAGQAYPDSPAPLMAMFDAFFTFDGGAGPIDGKNSDRRVVGLVSPHMDPRCCGTCASWALKALAESERPDLFVVFGTSHHPLPNLFSVSDKAFATPLGTVECDHEFIGRLRERFGADRLTGELLHRHEHSIEFQIVYLHALFGDPPPFRIVPILCGSFQRMIIGGGSPRDNDEVEEFCRAVRETIAESGKRVCCVAGADLAHMGHKFDDEEGLSDSLVRSTREKDLAMLGHLERLDAEGFFRDVQAEGNARKVCGLPPMYTMMRCIDPREGKLLRYDYSVEPSTESLVSFCSMAFYA